jgi:hypothetical protein
MLRLSGRYSVCCPSVCSAAEIGSELGVGYVVESSLRAEGPRLRITSKLIQVHDQSQVWSGSYDSEPASILAFQRELSVTIAEQVRLQLSPARLDAVRRRQTSHAEAYDLYLHGRHFWYQLNPTGTRCAIEYFERATALDPEYALARSGLADTYASSPVNGDGDPRIVWPKAQDAAGRAVRLAPDLAEAQTSMAFLKFWLDWDWPGRRWRIAGRSNWIRIIRWHTACWAWCCHIWGGTRRRKARCVARANWIRCMPCIMRSPLR